MTYSAFCKGGKKQTTQYIFQITALGTGSDVYEEQTFWTLYPLDLFLKILKRLSFYNMISFFNFLHNQKWQNFRKLNAFCLKLCFHTNGYWIDFKTKNISPEFFFNFVTHRRNTFIISKDALASAVFNLRPFETQTNVRQNSLECEKFRHFQILLLKHNFRHEQ